MRTLHAYLLREVMATLAMTALVFTGILLLGESMKEVFALLVNGQVGFVVVLKAMVLLIPFVLVFALPMGLLTAMLLVFGRFSADQELTAARACGISLLSLTAPIIGLGVACAGLCAWINLELAPWSRVAYKSLLYRVGTTQPSAFLTERTFIRDFPGCILYIGKVRGLQLEDVLMHQLDADNRKKNYLHAEQGKVVLDTTNRAIILTLMNGVQLMSESGLEPTWNTFGELELPPFQLPAEFAEKPRLNQMTWSELWDELHDLEQRLQTAGPIGKLASGELQEKLREAALLTYQITEPIKVQIHRQAAFSFACVGFTLVGIPLGIRAHRRETSFGFAIALVLVLVYYSFFILAQSLERAGLGPHLTKAGISPHLLQWIPNFLFEALGVVMLWRTNRGV